jgi:PAS domain S-box-containing protein
MDDLPGNLLRPLKTRGHDMERPWLSRLHDVVRSPDAAQYSAWPDVSRADFERLFETSHEGMFLLQDGVILHVNSAFAELLGCEPFELAGQQLEHRVVPDHVNRVGALQGDAGDVDTVLSLRGIHDSGLRDVVVRSHSMSGAPHRIFLVSAMDITDLRRSEQALRDHARRLRILSRQVIDVQEQERRHLARELHDEIGQHLTMIKMGLESAVTQLPDETAAAALNAVIEQVGNLMQQVRSLSLELRPSMLDDLGLGAALRWYAGRAAKLAGFQLVMDLPEDFPRLTQAAETAFFRVAQETINNLLKYAAATEVRVQLAVEKNDIKLRVADNGRGFDLSRIESSAASATGAGLLGMRERAALIGATLDVDAVPGGGCAVSLSAPITNVITSGEINHLSDNP